MIADTLPIQKTGERNANQRAVEQQFTEVFPIQGEPQRIDQIGSCRVS
jgi:hypothetical protein